MMKKILYCGLFFAHSVPLIHASSLPEFSYVRVPETAEVEGILSYAAQITGSTQEAAHNRLAQFRSLIIAFQDACYDRDEPTITEAQCALSKFRDALNGWNITPSTLQKVTACVDTLESSLKTMLDAYLIAEHRELHRKFLVTCNHILENESALLRILERELNYYTTTNPCQEKANESRARLELFQNMLTLIRTFIAALEREAKTPSKKLLQDVSIAYAGAFLLHSRFHLYNKDWELPSELLRMSEISHI